MATKLKLKTVFVLYFMVSLLGLVYALMQLGKLALHRSETGKHTSEESHLMSFLQDNAVTVPSMTCPKIGPYLGCGGNWTVFRSRWRSLRPPDSPRNKHPSRPYPPSLSSPRHMQGSCYSLLTTGARSSPHFSLHLVTQNTLFLTVQAGAEGRTDAIVPDVPPHSPAALDRGGGFSTQDTTGDWLPYEEWPDLHPPARAHRQGPQTAGGAGDGGKCHTCFSLLVSAVLTFLCSLSSAGWPQLAEAPWGGAEEWGPAVVEGGQKAPAWRRQAARGGLLCRRRQHVQPADIWRGGICINSYLSSPEQVFV